MKTGAKPEKIWITGGSGFLGGTLAALLRDKYEVLLSYHRHPVQAARTRGFQMDLNSREDVRKFFEKEKPSSVVHCAAMTDVDYCENHFEKALRVNAEASGILAEEAARAGSYLIYISTEAVYGDTPGPHRENEPLAPVNRYAASKLKGEEGVQKAGGKYLIARTGFEGWRLNEAAKLSFFEWLTKKFAEGEKFKVFQNRIFTPFSVYNFVEIIDEMIQEKITGLYNVEGPEPISYFEFGRKVAEIFELDASLMVPVLMEDVLKDMKRPHDTALDSSRIQARLKTRILGVEELLKDFKKREKRVQCIFSE